VLQRLGGERTVSPAYDLPSSQLYGDVTMAMSFGGRTRSDFSAADFVRLGEGLGIPERATRRSLAELADRTDRWLPDLGQLPFDRGQIAKLRRVIEHRRLRLTS
jgi:serine/threonine-protein kinase HipA